jgi:hypothetical protein
VRSFLFILLICYSAVVHSQTGTVVVKKSEDGGVLKGKVLDKKTNRPIPNAIVGVMLDTNVLLSTFSDSAGWFTLKPVPPGKYAMLGSKAGFMDQKIIGLLIVSGKTVYRNMDLSVVTSTKKKKKVKLKKGY